MLHVLQIKPYDAFGKQMMINLEVHIPALSI